MQVPLVLRGRRQAGLTAAGQALVEEGRKLLAASDDLVDIVRRRAAGSVGVVKEGGVGIRLLPLVLEALGRRAPGVDVKLEAAGSAEAMLRLQGGTLDVAIVASPQPATAGGRDALARRRNGRACPPHGKRPRRSRPNGCRRGAGPASRRARRCTA